MLNSLSLNPYYEKLVTSLHQIDALLDVATNADFADVAPEKMLNYFWIITDLLYKAKSICETLANIKVCPPTTEEQNHAN